MIYPVYSVKDEFSGFGQIFIQVNDACAVRDFSNQVNDNRSLFAKNPNDFALYKIGEFDSDTGSFVPGLNICVRANAVKKEDAR